MQPIASPADERVKPFRLVKYFTFTALIVLFLGALVIAVLNIHWARRQEYRKSEVYHQFLAQNLSHQISTLFVVPVRMRYGRILLRNPEQYELMDRVVRRAIHSYPVERVTIYDSQFNIVSYSFDSEIVGKIGLGGDGYKAALDQRVTSQLKQRGNWIEQFLGLPYEVSIVTYAPLRHEPDAEGSRGPVIGVVELVQDLSADYRAMYQVQILVVLTITVVMAALFIVLVFVVRRGEAIIEQRAQERLRLKEQLERAQHLSRLGEMVATVSHEIRNPLGIIRSSADWLNKKLPASDAASGMAGIIVEESERLNRIISDFLSFARPLHPDLQPLQLAEVLERTIQLLTPQLEELGLQVKRHVAPDLPPIRGDAALLRQTFLNLLLNAMQAMPKGGLIETRLEPEPGGVALRIVDHGAGISAEVQEKIWTPFFTTKEQGTGLGLAIVRNIVEAHGGSISIANQEGAGTCVRLALPAVRQEDNHGNGADRR